jgi:2,3-bisphosphoglycerate-independent phosphoglycerate mutase
MISGMKYIVVLADGMSDEPIEALNGLTPVMAAHTPVMDSICARSATGLASTIPQGFHPGSEIANMNILGYHPKDYFQGRGVLEAASLGLHPHPDDLVMRCNLVSLEEGMLINHSAGHITTAEAAEIIETLNQELGNETIRFFPGTSYRHILTIRGGKSSWHASHHTTIPINQPGHSFRFLQILMVRQLQRFWLI